jgi:shikimate dehydrogenase
VKLAIFGFPVRHSLSPKMQTAALRAVGLDWTYEAIEVAPEGFAAAFDQLRNPDWRGANVTIPHKAVAWQRCDARRVDAAAIGAVNTIVVENGQLVGHNTDAPGFLDVAGDVRSSVCAVLGAGGSSRAVEWALRSGGAADVRVISRRLANWTAEAIASCDLVVGCVPPDAEPPPLDRLAPNARIIDLVYYEDSALASAARMRGLRYQDGLEVLVRQGGRSFELWTGKTAPLDVMREAVRNAKDRQLESP